MEDLTKTRVFSSEDMRREMILCDESPKKIFSKVVSKSRWVPR